MREGGERDLLTEFPVFSDYHPQMPQARRPRYSSLGSAGCLLFDLEGVLYDGTVWQRWLLQLLHQMGLHTRYAAFFRLWDREYRDEVAWEIRPRAHALRAFLRAAGLAPKQIDEVEAAMRPRFREFDRAIRPFPHVRTALGQLAAQGRQLALVCSTPLSRDAISSRLARLRLASWFSQISSARDFPRTTTRQQRFAALARKLAIDPSETAYIGRDPAELEAATRAGMLAVAFNADADAVADVYLDQFDQLPKLLQASRSTVLQKAA